MEERKVSWVPSLVFGAGVLIATALGVYAPVSGFYGAMAALLYTVSLGTANVMERRMGPAFNIVNQSLRRYRQVTTAILIVAALVAPGWVAGLVIGFGVEGVAQLRHSPRCATQHLRKLWQRLRR